MLLICAGCIASHVNSTHFVQHESLQMPCARDKSAAHTRRNPKASCVLFAGGSGVPGVSTFAKIALVEQAMSYLE